MDSFSLSLELTIIRARNINLKSSKNLFIRCHLPAESKKRVKLDSQEISPKSNLVWNQTFSLDCLGNQDSIKWLKQGNISFELRQRSSSSFFNGSKLLAGAEMPWKEVFESSNIELQKWVIMIPKKGCVYDDIKPPAVEIAVKVQEFVKAIAEGKKVNGGNWDERGNCMDSGCKSCVDYEYFAIEAALEAF
ncbi:hypothetical protein CDL12_08388 [Handroanthus impetiginosus]|uniref:C2 domain-containing protein n=1 Tax=Handroanthus impetiginosus TaxID=429701 RepID=A0A2G9HN47_9LAMI|nr:hypothetical protein CDL12_08388 [Handroanthus impetiginosus]